MEDAIKVQPKPNGEGVDIVDLVKNDLEMRAVIGEKKYGQRLKAFNGRESLVDAYQEALDLPVYLKQAIVENNQLKSELDRLKQEKSKLIEALKPFADWDQVLEDIDYHDDKRHWFTRASQTMKEVCGGRY